MVELENQLKHLCVVCSKPLIANSFWVCTKCGKPCEYEIKNEVTSMYGTKLNNLKLLDIKSKCCDADVVNMQKTTCSDECHDKLVADIENVFEKFKKVVDDETGIAYKVPTKYIIENGLNQQELKNFPRWSE